MSNMARDRVCIGSLNLSFPQFGVMSEVHCARVYVHRHVVLYGAYYFGAAGHSTIKLSAQ